MRAWRAFIVAILLGIVTVTPAHADTVYAYWSYWQGDTGTWKYATTGPATAPAVDGAVDGWRFTLGSDGRAAHPEPAADFASVCGSTPKPSGSVRVAILIDYGTAADIPPVAACAVVESGLSRASALSAVATLRFNNGFICGINDIPQTGCGDAVASPAPNASARASVSPRASATPSRTRTGSLRPTTSARAVPTAETATAAAAAVGSSLPTIAPSSDATPTTAKSNVGDAPSSPLATVVTMLLAGVVLALALRNARRQRGSR